MYWIKLYQYVMKILIKTTRTKGVYTKKDIPFVKNGFTFGECISL